MNHDGKSRDDLARQANRVRSQLMRTVERLDRRRHQALDAGQRVQRQVRQILLLGGSLLLGAAAASAVAFLAFRASPDARRWQRGRRRRDRRGLAKTAWSHPERLLRAQRGSFPRELARSVLLAVLTRLVTQPAWRRAARRLLGPSNQPQTSVAGR
jgi:hypothetical protein